MVYHDKSYYEECLNAYNILTGFFSHDRTPHCYLKVTRDLPHYELDQWAEQRRTHHVTSMIPKKEKMKH